MRSRLVLALVLVAPAVPALAANPPRYLDKETFFQMESIANPEISPDGSLIVFSRGFVDTTKDQNQSNLWLVDGKGERLRQLTDGTFRDSDAGVVARRQADRVPLEPLGLEAGPRDVDRHARDAAAHARRPRSQRT